ncbi:MAG: O-antigen ligase family protein [Azovibrio sp.]
MLIEKKLSVGLWDSLLLLGLSLHILIMFLDKGTALGRIGLVMALIICLMDGRWRACLPFLQHPVLLSLFALIGWLGLTTFWSLDARLTLTSVWSVFRNYFLVIPPLFYQLSTPEGRNRFCKAMAYACVLVIGVNAVQYVWEYLYMPDQLLFFKRHRGWSHPLLFLLPFVLMQLRGTVGRLWFFWLTVLVTVIVMLLGTGARAAWLGMVAILLIGFSVDFTWRRFGVLAAFLLVVGGIAYATVPFIQFKVNQGLDTSGRIGGPWTSTLDMVKERPILGYGFSKKVYNLEFNRRASHEPDWLFKRSIGPHSNYLEIAYAGGMVGLGLLLALYANVGWCMWKRLRRRSLGAADLYGIAGLASFIGFYVIRGGFESVRWGPMIIAIVIICHFCGSKSVAAQKPEQIGSGHQ